MAGNVQEVKDSDFKTEVLNAPGLVLVDFWAPWCGPCRTLAPTFEQLAAENGDRAKFVKVNVDQSPLTANAYQIQGIPALLFFHRGKKVGELGGAQPKHAIQQRLDQLLRSAGSASDSAIVTCSSCGQKNRVPKGKSGEAVCGRCHQPLG